MAANFIPPAPIPGDFFIPKPDNFIIPLPPIPGEFFIPPQNNFIPPPPIPSEFFIPPQNNFIPPPPNNFIPPPPIPGEFFIPPPNNFIPPPPGNFFVQPPPLPAIDNSPVIASPSSIPTNIKVDLGNEFANTIAATVAANQIQKAAVLKIPTIGSTEYQSLFAVTGGASERPGFDYLSHVATMAGQQFQTSLNYAEVVSLIARTGKSDFTNFDLASYQKEKVLADSLISRFVADPAKTAPTIPVAGSLTYQSILKETGLNDLTGFDYAAYLSAKRSADLAVSTFQGSAADDVITAEVNDVKKIFVAGAGNDKVTATGAADILIGGAGNDILDGGTGLDKAVFSGAFADYKFNLANNQTMTITDSQSTRDGTDALKNIERLSFSDVSIALDTAANQNAGSVYMLYKAAFNRTSDNSGMGYWLAQKDNGADIITSLAQGFVNAPEFIAKYGANPSNSSYVDKLYQNVLGREGEGGGVAYWNAELNAGRISKAAILVQFATLAEGAANVAPLIANGISYTEWVG